MTVPFRHTPLLAAACALAVPCFGDEIRLKDGKKLYGVIVSYEENMFKVKTDYGYVLVEKDKIASIVPTAPAAKSELESAVKKETPPHPSKPANKAQPKTEPAVATAANTAASVAPANA